MQKCTRPKCKGNLVHTPGRAGHVVDRYKEECKCMRGMLTGYQCDTCGSPDVSFWPHFCNELLGTPSYLHDPSYEKFKEEIEAIRSLSMEELIGACVYNGFNGMNK